MFYKKVRHMNKMKSIAYYNGRLSTDEDIKIPLTDRAIYFGDGIYDAALVRAGKIYLFDEHITRFLTNAEALELDINDIKESIRRLLVDIAMMHSEGDSFLYFQLSRSGEKRKHAFATDAAVNLLITLSSIPHPNVTKTARLKTHEDVRHGMCHIKTLNLLPAAIAAARAEREGYDEALLVRGETVTECSHSNVFIIKDGRLITHPLDNEILPGIMRKKILDIARIASIPYEERKFGIAEVMQADEVLISSSSRLVERVAEIDGQKFPVRKGGCGELICNEVYADFIKRTE